ncbi:uncharacterized protein LOC129599862, partial [Paramacrobiotus metropolitanus]|uniref:uncharacterized protein LOC129599862 n=1 Tax=Paramacrobiotus metropolitanus TaxID=2943436 RepID=UPI002445C78B
CYTLPMLQVFPIHVSIITYFGLAYDRYTGIRYPDKRRSPVLVYTAASWLVALISVLPYASFIQYIDLEAHLGPVCRNRGLCFISLDKNVEDYLRATFFLIFFLPAAVMIYLLTRTSSELTFSQKNTRPVCTCDEECIMRETAWTDYDTGVTSNSLMIDSDSTGGSFRKRDNRSLFSRTFSLNSNHSVVTSMYRLAPTKRAQPEENNRNYDRRKSTNSETFSMIGVDCAYCCAELQAREQSRVCLMIVLFIVAWSPINIFLLMVRIFRDVDESALLSVINLILTAIGFTSTCWNPFITYPMIRRRLAMQVGCSSSRQRSRRHHNGHTVVSAQESLLSVDTLRKSSRSLREEAEEIETTGGKGREGGAKRATETNGNLYENPRPHRPTSAPRSRSPVPADTDRDTGKDRHRSTSAQRRPGSLSPAALDPAHTPRNETRRDAQNSRMSDQQRITQARSQFAAQRSPGHQGQRSMQSRTPAPHTPRTSFRQERDS